MHVDGPNQIPMSLKTAVFTGPLPIARLVCMPTGRTPAARSSFGAGEARHMGLFAFVGEIVHVFAIFPQRHTLVMVSPVVVITDSMGIANKECAHLFFDAKVNHFSRGFMTQITNTPFSAATLLVFCVLELFPAPGILFASTLLFGNLTKMSVSLPLQRTNTAPGDNQGFSRVGCYRCEMDFSQVYRCLNIAGCLFNLWNLNTNMEFKTVIPD